MNGLSRCVLIICVSLIATACGRRGVLLYPDMLITAAPDFVTAQQSGSTVKLQFNIPDKDRSGRPVQGVAGVKISRRAADTGQKDVCRSCTTDFRLFQTIYLDHLPPATQRFGSRLIVLDSEVSAGNSYSYYIVPFTADAVDGASSAIADVSVSAPLPAPQLNIESLPTEIKIHVSLHPLKTGRLLGYNLYRTSGEVARSFQPLNRQLMKGDEYVDSGLYRKMEYRYTVRALIMLESGSLVESEESQEVVGMLRDDE